MRVLRELGAERGAGKELEENKFAKIDEDRFA
jgi:hypothetical protein